MLNSLVNGHFPLLVLSLLLAAVATTSHTRPAYAAGSAVGAMAQTVCMLAETGPSDVLRVQFSCGR
jgi:hypothetical protein